MPGACTLSIVIGTAPSIHVQCAHDSRIASFLEGGA